MSLDSANGHATGSGYTSGGTGMFSIGVNTQNLTAGTYTLTYTYAGNGDLVSATNNSTSLVIGKVTPNFSEVQASPNSGLGGSNTVVAISGKVSLSGHVPAGGTVTATIGGQTSPAMNLDSTTGEFRFGFPTANLLPSTAAYAVILKYSGDENFNPQGDVSATLQVNVGSTTTTLTSSENPSRVGDTVRFSALVTSANNSAPTGTVTFMDGTTILATVPVTSGTSTTGTVVYSNGTFTQGNHVITAVYTSSDSLNGSTSGAIQQIVQAAASTATTLASSENPSKAGDTVTFTAVVTSTNNIAPTGTVAFMDGTTTLTTVPVTPGTPTTGTAVYKNSTFTQGNHVITAVYTSTDSLNGSTSGAVQQIVQAAGKVDSQVEITGTTPNPAVEGQTVMFAVTVPTVGGIAPTGNVSISEQIDCRPSTGCTNVPYSNNDLKNGSTTILVSGLTAGMHARIFATYGGDANYNGSTSQAFTLQVNPAQ